MYSSLIYAFITWLMYTFKDGCLINVKLCKICKYKCLNHETVPVFVDEFEEMETLDSVVKLFLK